MVGGLSRFSENFARTATDRLVFADALRVAIIVFVIVHHAAQAYGPTGGAWPVQDRAQSNAFLPFYTVNAAFGLGLLFLLAGYFLPRSYERKGAARFLKERAARIGLPLAIFGLLIHLPLAYLLKSRPPPGELIRWLYERGWQPIYLHLWFLGHLIFYSALYVAWRQLSARFERSPRVWPPPGHAAILGLVFALSLITWTVRIRYPVDKWIPLLGVLAAEPAHLPPYAALFAAGIIAHRGDWLRRLPTRVGMIWLGVGVLASAGVYVVHAFGAWDDLTAIGGFNVPSLVRSTWESLICASLSVGLVVLFRELFRRPHRLLDAMTTDSYAAYMLHPALVVGLQFGIKGLELPAVVKFALVSLLGVVIAFGIGHLSRWIPGVRMVLGTVPRNQSPHQNASASPAPSVEGDATGTMDQARDACGDERSPWR